MKNTEILKVLEKVKKRIIDKDFEIGVYGAFKAYGLCWLILDTILLLYENKIPFTHEPINIEDYISLCIFENAELHCKATKPNVGFGSELWWRDNIMNNPTPRLEFVDWLIKEYGSRKTNG